MNFFIPLLLDLNGGRGRTAALIFSLAFGFAVLKVGVYLKKNPQNL